MGVARMVGQDGRHRGLGGALAHAGHGAHIGLSGLAHASARPQTMLGAHAIAVGHALLHLGHVLVGQREVVGHHAAQVEHEGGDRVDLVGLERLGRRPRHRAVDVVPQRGQRSHLHQRGAAGKGGVGQARHTAGADVVLGRAADQGREHFIALAKDAMTRRALGFPHVLALGHRAGALGQALEVGAHVDVPGLDFLGRGGAADAGVGGRLRGGQARTQQQRDGQPFTKAEHCAPPRLSAPARSGWSGCDKSTGCRAPRATGGRSAAHNRFRQWRGFAAAPVCHPRPRAG